MANKSYKDYLAHIIRKRVCMSTNNIVYGSCGNTTLTDKGNNYQTYGNYYNNKYCKCVIKPTEE
jgi:hypothetical protein